MFVPLRSKFTQRIATQRVATPFRILWASVLAFSYLFAFPHPFARSQQQDTAKFFEERIRPVLLEHCIACHGPDKSESGLRLDRPELFRQGGESGALVEAQKPVESLLLQALRHEGLEMPPNKKLPDEQIEAFEAWVSAGALWPEYVQELTVATDRDKIRQVDREYWFFQPLSDPAVPSLGYTNPIDAFVAQKLQAQGLSLGQNADESVLVRRLYLDLLGVPPTFDELQEYLASPSRDAAEGRGTEGQGRYERLVDQLLDDPRYGERAGRFWLDLVRFAESDGFKQDDFRPSAYRYRDYVVSAFNQDIPYSQFIAEQLAGDELDPTSDRMNAATGYLRHWIYEYNQRDVRSHWDNILNDLTDVTGEALLGLGFSCARCHDHKFDPLLQKDYYRLQAFFAPIEPRYDIPSDATSLEARREKLEAWLECAEPVRTELELLERETRTKVVEAAIEKFPPDVRPALRKAQDQREPEERSIAVWLTFRSPTSSKAWTFPKNSRGRSSRSGNTGRSTKKSLRRGCLRSPRCR